MDAADPNADRPWDAPPRTSPVPIETVVVLVNPLAREVRGAWQAEARRGFGPSCRVEFVHANGRAELERVARDVTAATDRLLVVAGGDGSMSWVVNALGAASVVLGLLPLGTANDLARELALPALPAAAAARIRAGGRRRCDLLSVNGCRLCTVGGIGVAAESALAIQALRHGGPGAVRWVLDRAGLHAYWLVAGARVLATERLSSHLDIRVRPANGAAERSFSLDAHAVFVANQPRLGGRLRISPASRNDDGVFELCILPSGSRGALLATLGRLVAGMRVPDVAMRVIPATWARITCDRAVRLFGDGEALGEDDTFEIAIQPGALEVVGA